MDFDRDNLSPMMPQYSVVMRHPQFGWNTIHVSKKLGTATMVFNHCVLDHAEYSFSLRRIGSIPQSWESITAHDGTYDYSKGNV